MILPLTINKKEKENDKNREKGGVKGNKKRSPNEGLEPSTIRLRA